MNNLLKGSLFFISGAAIASFVTYKVVEKKYKDIADEEIASVKAMYERKLQKVELERSDALIQVFEKDEEVEVEVENQWPKTNPYDTLVTDLGYSNKKEEDEMEDNTIEVIPPEDFGEYGYECESLTYYTDDVLTYDDDTKITDVEKLVGPIALKSFGEYEDDSVFVRNHGMKTDFEILKEYRRYSDVVPSDDE